MSNPTPEIKRVIYRARFVHAVKLGAHELQTWTHERNGMSVESTTLGLVFHVGEDVEAVPWANVISYGSRTSK